MTNYFYKYLKYKKKYLATKHNIISNTILNNNKLIGGAQREVEVLLQGRAPTTDVEEIKEINGWTCIRIWDEIRSLCHGIGSKQKKYTFNGGEEISIERYIQKSIDIVFEQQIYAYVIGYPNPPSKLIQWIKTLSSIIYYMMIYLITEEGTNKKKDWDIIMEKWRKLNSDNTEEDHSSIYLTDTLYFLLAHTFYDNEKKICESIEETYMLDEDGEKIPESFLLDFLINNRIQNNNELYTHYNQIQLEEEENQEEEEKKIIKKRNNAIKHLNNILEKISKFSTIDLAVEIRQWSDPKIKVGAASEFAKLIGLPWIKREIIEPRGAAAICGDLFGEAKTLQKDNNNNNNDNNIWPMPLTFDSFINNKPHPRSVNQSDDFRCYFCGEIMKDLKTDGRIECEHILPIMVAANFFEQMLIEFKKFKCIMVNSFIAYLYAWSHKCCNQCKSNRDIISKTYNKNKQEWEWRKNDGQLKAIRDEMKKRGERDNCSNLLNRAKKNFIPTHHEDGIHKHIDDLIKILNLIENDISSFTNDENYRLIKTFRNFNIALIPPDPIKYYTKSITSNESKPKIMDEYEKCKTALIDGWERVPSREVKHGKELNNLIDTFVEDVRDLCKTKLGFEIYDFKKKMKEKFLTQNGRGQIYKKNKWDDLSKGLTYQSLNTIYKSAVGQNEQGLDFPFEPKPEQIEIIKAEHINAAKNLSLKNFEENMKTLGTESKKIFKNVTWAELSQSGQNGGSETFLQKPDPVLPKPFEENDIKNIKEFTVEEIQDKYPIIEYFGFNTFKELIDDKSDIKINFDKLTKLKKISVYYYIYNLKNLKQVEPQAQPVVEGGAEGAQGEPENPVENRPNDPRMLTRDYSGETLPPGPSRQASATASQAVLTTTTAPQQGDVPLSPMSSPVSAPQAALVATPRAAPVLHLDPRTRRPVPRTQEEINTEALQLLINNYCLSSREKKEEKKERAKNICISVINASLKDEWIELKDFNNIDLLRKKNFVETLKYGKKAT